MAITNHERVGKALELLKDGLRPYIERAMRARYASNWANEVKAMLNDTRLGTEAQGTPTDVAALLVNYVRQPFQREPNVGVTSVNYDFGELLKKAATPR